MKKITYLLAVSLFLNSCNSTTPDKKTENERDSLQAVIHERDSTISGYLTTFRDVEHILDSINLREKSIYLKTEKPSDLKKPMVIDQINSEIKAINNLIKKNSQKIEALNAELRSGNTKNKQLEEAVRKLNTQLSQKENELADLNSKLTELDLEIFKLEVTLGVLYAENAIKDETIQTVTEDLQTAYYITGSSKELEKNHIIDKKGGLLGIGKSSTLNNNFETSKFIKINYTETISIPLNSKKAEIITSHPTNAYRLEKDKGIISRLIITDAEEFWKASKYLVIIKQSD